MSFRGDERYDFTAVDAIEAAATPPRPKIQPRPYFVILLDESGPLDSFCQSADLSTDKLIEVARAFWPKRDLSTVLTAEWAEKRLMPLGREFHITVPGTHEVKAKAPKRERKQRQRDEDMEMERESRHLPSRGDRVWNAVRRQGGIAAPTVTDSTPAVSCRCGANHTVGAYYALPLLNATERKEGSTVLVDFVRQCACGAQVVWTSKRLVDQ